MTTSFKNNFMHPGLISNLQEVLISRKEKSGMTDDDSRQPSSSSSTPSGIGMPDSEHDSFKPVVLLTNGAGVDCPGLSYLAEALVREELYNVHICAPKLDNSLSGHSMTFGEIVAVTSTEIKRAPAFEVSGTPADCVSMALSGALFSWSKPVLVISGINKGSCCGHQMFCSGVVAGAREALIWGVPSISISLNWKGGESQETDFQGAVSVCLPLINAAIRDIKQGNFPESCLLCVDIPTSPLLNKGFKVTKQSLWRCSPTWQAVATTRVPGAGKYLSNQQSLGIQLAQLSRDASAAGAARRNTSQKKNVEIESVGVAGKSKTEGERKYFRLEFLEKQQQDMDECLDFRALEDGFVAVTPFSFSLLKSDMHTAVSEWICGALGGR